MTTYTISWKECTDCQKAVRAETEDEAIALVMGYYMDGQDIADTKGKPYAEDFEVVDEDEED